MNWSGRHKKERSREESMYRWEYHYRWNWREKHIRTGSWQSVTKSKKKTKLRVRNTNRNGEKKIIERRTHNNIKRLREKDTYVKFLFYVPLPSFRLSGVRALFGAWNMTGDVINTSHFYSHLFVFSLSLFAYTIRKHVASSLQIYIWHFVVCPAIYLVLRFFWFCTFFPARK